MPLYLKLNVKQWVSDDFTSVDANGITGTVYSNQAMSTTVDLTVYTSYEVILVDSQGRENTTDTANLTLNADGTFRYEPPNGKILGPDHVEFRLTLKRSTETISTIGLNGSADLLIY